MRRIGVPTVVLALALFAWGQQSHTHHQPPSADPNWTELSKSMDTMHVAMASLKPSGNTDVDFVRMMLPHHQAAVDMAKAQLLYGKDPQMRRLAQQIITDQQLEIQLMELWLKQHATDAPLTHADKEP